MAQQKRPQRPVYPQEERTAKRMPQRPVYSGEYPPPHQRRKAPTRVDYSGISPIITRRKEPQAAPFVNDLPARRTAAPQAAPSPTSPPRRQTGSGAQAPSQQRASRTGTAQQAAAATRRQPERQRTWHDDAAPPARLKPHAPVYDQNAGRSAARHDRPAPKKKRRRKRPLTPRQKRLRGVLIGGTLCLAALVAGALFSMKVLFKLSNIEVRQPEEETTVYSDEQITAALGLEMGTQLFSIDLEQATQTLSTALPYLREVQVRRRLPATLVVSVQPAHETYAVAYEGGWAVVSEDLKVLRLSAEQPQGIAAVTGLEASAPAEGQPLQVAQADKLEALQTLQAQAQAAGLEQLTAIDMTSLSEVSAVYAGRVKITFGTMNDIEYKCSWAARLLLGEDDSAMIGEHETGTLDVSHRTQDGKGQAIWRAGAI